MRHERPTIETWYEGRRVRPGDFVTKCHYSDRDVYEVVEVSPSGKTLVLHPVKHVLLNGFKSGEPDALVSHPGGFAHHVTGTQRYRYERLEHEPGRYSRVRWSEKRRYYQSRGGHPTLIPGAHAYYDYNF